MMCDRRSRGDAAVTRTPTFRQRYFCMDAGGRGLFGDGGGLSILACLCPCLGAWLLFRYSSDRRNQYKKDLTDSPKRPPSMVGKSKITAKSTVVATQSAVKFHKDTVLDVDGYSSSDAGTPHSSDWRRRTSDAALLAKDAGSGKKLLLPQPKTLQLPQNNTHMQNSGHTTPSSSAPLNESERNFDDLSSNQDASSSSDESGQGHYGADVFPIKVIHPMRKCLSANDLKASSARAMVPKLDLSIITGEPPPRRVTIAGSHGKHASERTPSEKSHRSENLPAVVEEPSSIEKHLRKRASKVVKDPRVKLRKSHSDTRKSHKADGRQQGQSESSLKKYGSDSPMRGSPSVKKVASESSRRSTRLKPKGASAETPTVKSPKAPVRFQMDSPQRTVF